MKASRIAGVMLAIAVAAGLLFPHLRAGGQDRSDRILAQKWVYKIQERVYLSQPSGWHSLLPWVISSPALGDLGHGSLDLEVVTGTEEGYYEWYPRGANSGRYIGIDARGRHLWDYNTQNNAGRASPGIVDVDADGSPECLGGSTSGWMVHLFNGAGQRRWRYEVANNANVLAAPAAGELTDDPGLETVAVALDGHVYCLGANGSLLWRCAPAGNGRGMAAACAAIADLTGDGRAEVVVVLPAGVVRAYCLDGATGRALWESEGLGGSNTVLSAPAILPKADPCWRQTGNRSAGDSRVIVAAGTGVHCLAGGTGKQIWTYAAAQAVPSSPAVGDVDGDGAPDIVVGSGRDLVCINAYSGKRKWKYETGGNVYSSPALGDRASTRAHRLEWPMYRHDPARTGFYGFQRGPLGVYVGSDDGYMHLVDGRTGAGLDRIAVRFPDLIIQSGSHGALRFLSSPSVADIDGNGTLEAVCTLVDRVWCFEDLASNVPRPRDEAPPARMTLESAKKNIAPSKNHFALAQVVHAGGWNPTVPVHERLLTELTLRANLTVMKEMVPVSLRDDDVARFPFLYLTGHEAAAFSDDEVRRLSGHLDRGGFLLAEACCNAEPFDKSMRGLAEKLDAAKLVRLRADHPIFNCVYVMRQVTIKGKSVEPEFYGIERKGRIVLLYTPHDYGCSWGNPCCTSGCNGVTSEDSYRMMTNIVAYALLE